MEFLMTIIKITWIALGFVCFGLGTLGVVLPVLPTVPFYMATAYCFAKAQTDYMIGLQEHGYTGSIWIHM